MGHKISSTVKDSWGVTRFMNMFSGISWARGGGLILGAALCLTGGRLPAQETISSDTAPPSSLRNADWLKPIEDQQRQAASGSTFTATAGHDASDPFSVLSTGSLWQEKYGTTYTRRMGDAFALSYETSAVTLSNGPNPYLPLSDGSDNLSQGQKAAVRFRPVESLTLSGNVHNSISDGSLPSSSVVTHGTGFAAESRLPFRSVLTLGVNADESGTDLGSDSFGQSKAYDAQLQQPLGKMPLTAEVKGHYDETTAPGTTGSKSPFLEQSLVWKPEQDTTVKFGLRQQHYQDFPGISNEFNQAIFADWSQKILPDVSWHSYAEVLNSRGVQDVAPAVPIASGANGTPQATTPGPTISSALPVTLDDKTLTFSTGPSFLLEKNLSASIEYSNRWDQNPLPGAVGQEQRVSVSLKGTF